MLILAISLSVALFFFLMSSFLFLKKGGTDSRVQSRIRRIKEEAREEESILNVDSPNNVPLYRRTVGRFISNMATKLSSVAPSSMPAMMERKIVLAGKQGEWNPTVFAGVWFISLVFFGFLSIYYVSHSNTEGFKGLFIIWAGMLFGGALPFIVLNRIIRKRQDAIMHQLPEVLDILSVSVRAGLSFDGSIRKVVERMKGPLIDEFNRMLVDMNMGMTRRRSMKLMADRCEVQDVSLFVMSIIQSEQLGASMGETLNIQADNMRNLRKQRARRKAMQAPVKMIFPLVFCVFPAIFVIVLLPSVINILQTMGK